MGSFKRGLGDTTIEEFEAQHQSASHAERQGFSTHSSDDNSIAEEYYIPSVFRDSRYGKMEFPMFSFPFRTKHRLRGEAIVYFQHHSEIEELRMINGEKQMLEAINELHPHKALARTFASERGMQFSLFEAGKISLAICLDRITRLRQRFFGRPGVS